MNFSKFAITRENDIHMATISDIAKLLGISKSTVSKGLNNATDISEEMRVKIIETAAMLGYTNKHIKERNKKICIIVENIEYNTPNQFGYDIIQGFRKMAEQDEWTVDIVPIDKDFQRGIPYNVFMIQNDYAASFILGFSLIDTWMAEFKTCKIPTVLYDNFISCNPMVASVSCDCRDGFEEAVKHLMSLGHKKIGLISGPLESYIIKERYNAYINVLSKYNLEINEDFIGLNYYIADSTKENVQRMFDLGITAILFSHDVRAISAITECMDRGIRVPKDLSIIGFDDLPMAAYTEPPLTTIRQDRLALGKAGYYAMSCLLDNLPIGAITLRAPLIVRGSTGPARNTDI